MQPPDPPLYQQPSSRIQWIVGAAAAFLAIGASVAGCSSFASKPSAEEQIQDVVTEFTQALNVADAAQVNALSCRKERETDPLTDETLHKRLQRIGTMTTTVESIDISGDHATVRNTQQTASESQTGSLNLVHEDGSWKLCGND